MKKISNFLLALLFLLTITTILNATTISYESTISDDDGTLTTVYNWATIETFDSGTTQNWTWTGSGAIVTGDLSGKYAAPAISTTEDDATHYVTVPHPSSVGSMSYETSFGETYNYFGLFWGSIDDYNTISFYKDLVLVDAFNGLAITNPANGDQTAASNNLYVNFHDIGDYNRIVMTSTGYAFEADNLAVGNNPVPEPATMLLFGLGLLGLAGVSRRKK